MKKLSNNLLQLILKKLVFIFSLVFIITSSAQECSISTRTISKNLDGKFQFISKLEYENIDNQLEKYIEISPITETELIQKHPEIFTFKDSCYIFSAIKKHPSTE